jgi:hypothetical protein
MLGHGDVASRSPFTRQAVLPHMQENAARAMDDALS